MATLVLSAVGTAVGGPIGGAIGALLGQAVDRRVLGPKRREGPRLTELAVQVSRYGAPIPRLFGTMRVAGTVIWATDLVETRGTTRAGKGQPGVTNYSYAASFAVLLSARAIRGVGRIWADGTLLRGAAGDFKADCIFRLHRGGEAQAVDPLIASAENGTGGDGAMAPAHRGCAYAVFEGLALAAFGNRIPSLTLEVIADDQPVPVGAIAAAIAEEVTVADATSGNDGLAVDGFAATGGSVRAVLETLAQMSGAVFAAKGDRLTMREGGGPVVTLHDAGVDAGVSADVRARPGSRTMAPADIVPRSVVVTHYDPARDYQAGLQRVRRPGAGLREQTVEVPAALSAMAAKTVAHAVLARAEAQRRTRTLAIGPAALAVMPGQQVAIAGEAGRWRVTAVTVERMTGRVDLVPVTGTSIPVPASSGRVLAATDAAIGPTRLAVFETLPLDDAVLGMPRLSVLASGGPGWRQAALLYSLDDGASWIEGGGTALPGVIGRVDQPPPAGSALLVDPAATMTVTLAEDWMRLGDADADAAARAGGGNIALVGNELIRFGRATPIGGGRWRLDALARGRRGTEPAIGTQRAGDRFVLVARDTVRSIDLPTAMTGRSVRVIATGVGDRDGPAVAAMVVTGASILPPAPVHLAARRLADGAVAIAWIRRSRAGWDWIDGVDAPLVEEREAYVVTVETADGILRTAETDAPYFTVPAGDMAAGAVGVAVAQRGTLGLSIAARMRLSSGGIGS